MWWNLLQGNDRVPKKKEPAPPAAPDKDLDEWNLYLQVMEAAEGEDTA
jgi:hypothetical protein